MHYIGLDLSLTNSGLVILGDKAETELEVSIKSKPHKNPYTRIRAILEAVHNHLPPDNSVFMVEGFAFSAKGKVFDIAEMSGVIKYHINQVWYAAPIFYQVPPSVLKLFITGKGNSGKELIIKEVYKKYGKDYTDNNIADAYALARMGWTLDNPAVATQYQMKAIESMYANNGVDDVKHLKRSKKNDGAGQY